MSDDEDQAHDLSGGNDDNDQNSDADIGKSSSDNLVSDEEQKDTQNIKLDIQNLIKIQRKSTAKEAKVKEEEVAEDNFDDESLASIFSQDDDEPEEPTKLGKRPAS